MSLLIPWIKKNWLAILLTLIILYLIFGKSTPRFATRTDSMALPIAGGLMNAAPPDAGASYSESKMIAPQPDFAPQAEIANRMVIQESDMSLLVKDVNRTKNQIIDYANQNGGYMVNSYVSNPADAPSATVSIRIKSAKIKDALEFLRSLSIKVVSENLQGYDVTDQYVDIDKRIAILEESISQIRNILTQAREISDISNLTQQILNLQSQIDSYKGQQEALEKNADLAKITVYLSTDEIALPYAPSDTFRPAVIFKMAVRALVSDLRGLATKAIWVMVYAVIWIPLLLILYLIKIKFLKK